VKRTLETVPSHATIKHRDPLKEPLAYIIMYPAPASQPPPSSLRPPTPTLTSPPQPPPSLTYCSSNTFHNSNRIFFKRISGWRNLFNGLRTLGIAAPPFTSMAGTMATMQPARFDSNTTDYTVTVPAAAASIVLTLTGASGYSICFSCFLGVLQAAHVHVLGVKPSSCTCFATACDTHLSYL
jgi:hypothetical protein